MFSVFNFRFVQSLWKYILLLIIGGSFFPLKGWGQLIDSFKLHSNLHIRNIPIQDSLVIDSNSIDFNSFSIPGISDSNYHFFPEMALLVWKHLPEKDSVLVRYRSLPVSFSKKFSHKNKSDINTNIAFPFYSFSGAQQQKDADFVHFNSIEYNGTYGRSLTIGNQQDVTLNSNFDLQLNGYILDSVRIEAALSDNNIPFQPEGNTQQIQEFDKIYITFQKGLHKLTAGDYEITRPHSYFMNFNKRVQGLYYEGTFPKTAKIQNKIGVSGSIAKGEFARNIFQGQEGNQGPYKLTGNNGEQFFIVMAGSEKVYIDGILMQRGEDRDYTIDYNTAEITFMPRQMITKDSRIQVEFEYQSRNYLNTLFYVYDELKIKDKWQFKFNAYSNQDAKNQPYLQDLTGTQKQFLRSIGDRINEAYYPNIRQDTFANNKVLYRMTDTFVNGVLFDSVFVYSNNEDSTLYSLGFSFVGANKGNYNLAGNNTNGRSYTWVAPLNGIPQGNYAPFVLLITPKKQQMFTLSAEFQPDSLKKAGIELATSNYVPNLFADKNTGKHWGFAGKGFYSDKRYFGSKDSLGKPFWSWKNTLKYEWSQSQFKPIAPFRDVEFNRDWNLNDSTIQETTPDDHLIIFESRIQRKNLGNVNYNFTRYQRGSLFQAYRNLLQINFRKGSYSGGATFNLMHSSDTSQTSNYLRPSAFLEKKFTKLSGLTLGAKWEEENNEIRQRHNDFLSSAAFAYNKLGMYLKSGENKKTHFNLAYNFRSDQTPGAQEFISQSQSHTIEGNLNIGRWKGQQITLTAAYRNLITDDTTLSKSANGGQNILARLQYNGNILKGFLIASTLYELGSGQQQKQEYVYVKVPTGQGVYMWVDYNKDSVEQENEFEIALYPDQKQYIRIISPTNDYVAVNYVTLNQSLNLRPENLWLGKKKNKLQSFISRFSEQFSLQISNRSLASVGFKGFNPFSANSIADENILVNSSSFNNTFYFNQLSPIWGANYNYFYRSGKSLLSYGLEGNTQERHSLETRIVFFKRLTATVNAQMGTKSYYSAVPNDSKTYLIHSESITPGLTWIQPSLFRIRCNYKWDERQNRYDFGNEKAQIQSIELNARFSFLNTGNISLTGTYAAISYNGKDNTPLAFAMLDALKNGKNWLWHVSWDRNIGKGIQISLEYDGRKPAGSDIIHTGTMSIRALL